MSRRRSPAEPATGTVPDVASNDPIERLAFLLGPVDGSTLFSPADERWRLPDTGAARTIVWGRSASPSGTHRVAAARGALARERALVRARRRRGARVHRIPPQTLGVGRLRNAIRSMLLGGAVVELPASPSPRVLDAATAAAGITGATAAFHLSSSGAILVRVRTRDADAVLRVGVAGAPGDPSRGAAGLAHLAATTLPVPRLIATGEAAGAAWSLETLLPGRRPSASTPALLRDVARLCEGLPAGNGPPAAPRRDLEAIAGLLSDRADPLNALAGELRAALRSLPSVMRHGDLWTGNLLVDGGELSGVVDWDAWDPGAVPGADLLHLHATARRIAERCELGEIWATTPWRDDDYRSVRSDSAAAVPDDVVATAWWASEVRGTLTRHPARAGDERWLAVNVDAVIRSLRP